MLSIIIASTSYINLEKCLKSIKEDNVEVIVNNANEDLNISDLINKYRFIEINKKTNILESRYITGIMASGEYTIIMDDSRFFAKDFFSRLNLINLDIGVINELEEQNTSYDKLINRQIKINYNSNIDPKNNMFLLPRIYKTCILQRALKNIKNSLPNTLFKNIKAMDLELIYYEAYEISNNIKRLNDNYIIHASQDIIKEIKKFYKYGKNTRLLKSTKYAHIGQVNSRIRKPNNIEDIFVLLLVYTIRGIPFLLGYILNS